VKHDALCIQCEKKSVWPNLRYRPGDCVDGLRKIMKSSVRVGSVCPSLNQDLQTVKQYCCHFFVMFDVKAFV
jgi:hypothetical protein